MAPKEKQPGSRMTNTITIHMHLDPLLCPVTVYTIYVSCLALGKYYTAHQAFLRPLLIVSFDR